MSEDRHPIIIETWCKTNGCRADVYRQEIRRLKDEKFALEARLSKMEEALEQIVEWSKAYPIDVFPEPDFEKVAKVLKDNGMTLDAVSASNMRHVITEVAGMATAALAQPVSEQ